MQNPQARESRMSLDENRLSSALVSVGARAASHSVAEAMTSLARDKQFRLSTVSSARSSLSISDATHVWTHQGFSASDVRPSRASSVISTHTKTSITTVHDEYREIVDVRTGQEAVFSLGWDGSNVYVNHSRGQQPNHLERTSSEIDGNTPRPTFSTVRAPQPSPAPAAEPSSADIVARNPSFKPGGEKITVQRRRSSSNSTSIHNNSHRPAGAEKDSTKLRRRGGVRLKVVTRNSSGQIVKGISPLTPNSGTSHRTASSQYSGSARTEDDAEPGSPAYIGRNASGTFPSTEDLSKEYAARLKWAESDDCDAPLSDHSCKEHGSLGPQGWLGRDDTSTSRNGFSHKPTALATGLLGAKSKADQENSQSNHPGNATSPALVVTVSPAHVDDVPIGARSPPSMDTENEVSIHYSRLVRSIDANYRNNLQAKDEELSEARDLLEGLARQALDLKAELFRTKSQVAAMSDAVHIQKMAREQTIEAQSFSFPPLKLNHIGTLKRALRRRREKVKRSLDDELGWLIRATSSSSETGKTPTDKGENDGGVDEHKDVNKQPGTFDHTTQSNTEDNEAVLLRSLFSTRRRLRSLETEQQILQGQVINLRETVDIWKTRCQKLEQERMINPSKNHMDDIAQVKRDVEELWEARWHHRHEQLSDRMRRIEEDARKAFQEAVAAKDKRLFELEEKCADLSTRLKQKEEDIQRLKSSPNSSDSDSS